ncbi:hypothetical protein [Nocardioides sp.]|uniref:hypothetical protein n=1 Tax=Nocardioides sp. TaxID=35761 RepID=UPI002CB05C78|nr:hypothetical protein [Nocardioides sp.]HXH79939.1 hypothetical protein [Nocardioides sp.]
MDGMKIAETVELVRGREDADDLSILGYGTVEVIGPDGNVKQSVDFHNLVTDVGDLFYANRAIGAAVTALTGMQIGSGITAAAKSGLGGAMVTLLAGQAFDATFPSVNNLGAGLGVEVVYKTTYAAGVGTGTINEVVITNGAIGTASTAAQTISRVVLGTGVGKAAGDSLAVTYRTKMIG